MQTSGACAVATRWRPYLILAGLGLIFFGALLFHPTQVLYSEHSDLLAMHLPMKRFLVRSWQQTGELPLWNPYSFGGMPFIHDVQVAAFYPLHLPLYCLPEEWVGTAMSWLVVLHVLIAGWCMFYYARSAGLAGMAALVAALGYMFAGKWLLHVLAGGHYIMIPLAWLPLVLLLLESAIRRGSMLRATWAGAVFAVIVLGTHPQMTLYAGLFVAAWTLQPLTTHHSPLTTHHSPLRWAGLGVWVAIVAALLSAVQLLPALDAVPESSRGTGVSPHELWAAALPTLFGLIGPPLSAAWEGQAGLGILWLAAAVTAPVICRGRARFEAGIVLAMLGFALGGAVVVQGLPGFRLFQIPGRMLIVVAFPVALLVARTSQALFAEGAHKDAREHCRFILIRVLAVGLLVAVASAGIDYWQSSTSFLDWLCKLPTTAKIYWLLVFLSAPACYWLLGPQTYLQSRACQAAWVAILLADAWAISWPQVAVRDLADIYRPSHCIQDLVDRTKQERGDRVRVLDRGIPGLPSSSALGSALPMFGSVQLEPVLGYNTFDCRRYREFLQFIMDEDRPIRPREGVFGYPIVPAFPIQNKALLDLLGVRYLLQPRDEYGDFDAGGEPAASCGWRKIAEDSHPAAYSFLAGGMQALPPYSIYENQSVLPRAFVVTQARPLAERSQVLKQLRSTDFRREALLEDFSGDDGGQASTMAIYRDAEIREYTPNRVTVGVRTNQGGFLVLTDISFKGWTCTVDGKPTVLHRADYLFRAVPISAGSHEVVFQFAPASYQLGKWISGISLLALVLASLLAGVRAVPLTIMIKARENRK